MSGSRPNKVALTILAGLALIGLFAVTQSGVAILAIARFGATFNQIAETNLPALIASSRMSELSQTLVAAAPEIALADTQLRRQTIEDQLNDRVASLVRTVARLDGAAVDQEQVSEMRRQLDELFVNLKGLNELVRERIDATNALEAVMARLPRVAARVRSVADDFIISEQDRNQHAAATMSDADRARLVEWSAASVECITLMLATPTVRNTSRLERVKSELSVLVGRMEDVRGTIAAALAVQNGGMHHVYIARFGLGAESITSCGAVRSKPNSPSRRRCGSFSRPAPLSWPRSPQSRNATQRDIGSRSAYFSETVSHFTLLSIATSFLCLAAGTAIFVYVQRAVIARLKVLQQYMRGQVEGRPAAIPIAGEDEITEMATATEFFVTELTKRQEALAAAKEAAEAARDVAERARAEAAAARADVELTREVLQTVLDNMSDGIVLFDKDYRLKFINHQLMSFQRYPSEVTRPGTSIYDLLRFQAKRGDFGPPEDVDRIVQEWAALVLKPEAIVTSGTRQVVGTSNSISNQWEGGGLLAVSRDITELTEREEALAAAKKAAEIARDGAEQARTEAEAANQKQNRHFSLP